LYIQDYSGEELPSEAKQLEAARKARLEAITEGKQPPPVIVYIPALSPEERAERLRQREEYRKAKAIQMAMPEELEPSPAATSESPAPAKGSSEPVVIEKPRRRESVTELMNRIGWPGWRF
jgi:hypothetical protein